MAWQDLTSQAPRIIMQAHEHAQVEIQNIHHALRDCKLCVPPHVLIFLPIRLVPLGPHTLVQERASENP